MRTTSKKPPGASDLTLPTRPHTFRGCVAALILAVTPLAGRADNFQSVAYDSTTDELVIVVLYRGTNPDHDFSLQWGSCQTNDDGNLELVGDLLDQQAQDAAQTDFQKTVRFSIKDLDCRPATLTLRTAPRFYTSLRVPVAPATTK